MGMGRGGMGPMDNDMFDIGSLLGGFNGMGGLSGIGGMGGMSGVGGMGMGGRPRPGTQPSSALKSGTPVVVQGLASKPEHNGKTGQILKFDESRSRYDVEVNGATLSLKPQNLTQQCSVEVVNLENKPELNGSSG